MLKPTRIFVCGILIQVLIPACKGPSYNRSNLSAESQQSYETFIGNSILATELSKLEASVKECNLTDYEISQLFPEEMTGPAINYKKPDGTFVVGKALNSEFKGRIDRIQKRACTDMTKLATVISAVEAKATKVCAEEKLASIPKYEIFQRAIFGDFSQYADGVAKTRYQKEGAVWKREVYLKNDRIEAGRKLGTEYVSREATKHNAGTTIANTWGTNAVATSTSTATVGVPKKVIDTAYEEGKRLGTQDPSKAGIDATGRCENGTCVDLTKNTETWKDPMWNEKEKRPKNTKEIQDEAEKARKEKNYEPGKGATDPGCQALAAPQEGDSCRPVFDSQRDPLEECVTQEVREYYDEVGRTRFANKDFETASQDNAILSVLGICDTKKEGAEFCRAVAQAKMMHVDYDQAMEAETQFEFAKQTLEKFGVCAPQILGQDVCRSYHEGLITREDMNQVYDAKEKEVKADRFTAAANLAKKNSPSSKTCSYLAEGASKNKNNSVSPFETIGDMLNCKKEKNPGDYNEDGILKPLCTTGSDPRTCRQPPKIPGTMIGTTPENPTVPKKPEFPGTSGGGQGTAGPEHTGPKGPATTTCTGVYCPNTGGNGTNPVVHH